MPSAHRAAATGTAVILAVPFVVKPGELVQHRGADTARLQPFVGPFLTGVCDDLFRRGAVGNTAHGRDHHVPEPELVVDDRRQPETGAGSFAFLIEDQGFVEVEEETDLVGLGELLGQRHQRRAVGAIPEVEPVGPDAELLVVEFDGGHRALSPNPV